ncbi:MULTISPECIES: hypothetical protein [unclassified Xanthobacter]|uniref:hypothetical protein n=1 Tax=unclassified Xanthobacter TaxID=2623496 RepID=UPI001F1AE0CD|nr:MULTISPECIES: hypothetical protein [unclassified Xanthobacter]
MALATLVAVMLGVLVGSMGVNVVVGARLVATADVIAFVADGGVAGCAGTLVQSGVVTSSGGEP